MLYDASNPYDADNALAYVNSLIKAGAKFEIRRKMEQRTLPQNNYFHLILRYWATQYGCSEAEAELDFFKRTANRDVFGTGEYGVNGVEKLRSSASLSTSEMSNAIERFRNWSAAVAGIYIPSPDEREFQFRCMQEIQKNKEFI